MRKTRVFDYICLFLMLFLGSIITYLAMNLFWSDAANGEKAFNWPLTLATLPMLMFALSFVAFAIFFVRYLAYEPQYKMRLVRLYTIILASFNFVGLVSAILCGTYVYDSILTPCPFPGSIIVYIVVHSLLLIAHLTLLVFVSKKICEKDVKAKITVKYIFYTIFMALFTFIAFDRAGAAFISPINIEWSSLELTWYFYLSLFLPMVVLITLVLFKLKKLKLGNYKARTILWGIYSALCVGLCLSTVLVGLNNQLLISLVSPAMPVERLTTLPIDLIILYVPIMVITITEFVISLVKLVKTKNSAQE